jgi:integrase
VAKALARFEEYNKMRAFKAFNYHQAVAFKNCLAERHGQRSTEKLSKATLYATLANLKRFFQWLSGQSGYKSRIQYSDADYFNMTDKDVRVAKARRGQKVPTLEQVRHVIARMPVDTDIQKRNRALIGFTLLTGARDGAIASMKLKHIDLQEGCVHQDARDVKTKFSKSFTTYFFPVGDDIRTIVEDWVKFLREVKLWGNDDPLFPATLVEYNDASHQFEAAGLNRSGWSSASPIRNIFREAFECAELPYFNPHSFRDAVVHLGEAVCKSPEDFKAWSQNLGHEKVLTTFTSYGEVAPRRQSEIMRSLAQPQADSRSSADEIADAVVRKLKFVGV